MGPAVVRRALSRFREPALPERGTVLAERIGRTGRYRTVATVRGRRSRGVGAAGTGRVCECTRRRGAVRCGRLRGTQDRWVRALVRAGVHARPDRGGHVRTRIVLGGPEVRVQRIGRGACAFTVGTGAGTAAVGRTRA